MAVLRRKPKKADLTELVSGKDKLSPQELLARAQEKGIETDPLDIERLVRSFGIRLSVVPMDDEISGHLSLDEKGWIISINSLHHPKRQRFTLAHELGHYLL